MKCHVSLVAVVALIFAIVNAAQTSRSIQIVNESGQHVEIYWVHPDSSELHIVSNPNVMDGASFNLNSFVGHSFEVREVSTVPTGECSSSGDGTCLTSHFHVDSKEDQIFVVGRGLAVRQTDSKQLAMASAVDSVETCQQEALRHITEGGTTVGADEATENMNALLGCLEKSVSRTFERSNEEVAFQASVRTDMAALLENYTCADESLPSSQPKEIRQWVRDGVTREVKVLHERDSSRIHVVSDFINEEECQAMEDAAEPILHRATVADGAGGSQLSDSRRAMQAGIKVPWQKEADGDPIATVSRKVYDYVNHVLGLDIDEFGQEDLMSIQYFGRGENDTAPDRYMPHCDGDCGGLEFKPGNRMSTMVMYCKIPSRGGATNFRNAGLHVVPEKGAATFFSYIDPETKIMDKGFTEHSGCPVVEGEKKIVTQWVRLGVDSDNPWDSFNTLGIKKSDAEAQ